MGQDPSVIRAEIEETRARVGDEVDALSYKTDVGARASDFVDEKTGGKYGDKIDQGVDKAKDGLDNLDGQNDDIPDGPNQPA